MKTLIIDDNPENIDILLIILQNSGYNVDSATNGREALDMLHVVNYDLIISDILMPVMDGFQLCMECKKDDKLKKIPFIFYSATYTDSKDEELALSLGAQKFIRKPQEPEDLLLLIKETIEKTINASPAPTNYINKDEKEVLKLYSERLIAKLEKKNLNLEQEIVAHKITLSKLKESEELYRLISTVTSDYMFSSLVDADGNLKLKWSAGAFEKITGYTMDEYIAIGGWRATLHPDDFETDNKDMEKLHRNEQVVTEIRTINKDGNIVWVRVYAHPVWDEMNNRLIGIYGAVQDINERKLAEEETVRLNKNLEKLVKARTIELEMTNADLQNEIIERTKAEEQIKQQLLEREVLLKEIHHRVKNNMMVIMSILGLQVSLTKSKKLINILQDCQNRIETMALIHEKLYKAKDFTNINFTEYINDLLDYLLTSYKTPELQINHRIITEPVSLDINTIVALGLITSELVSNAFKYAFSDKEDYELKVILQKTGENNLLYEVSDNGKGFPSGFDYKNTDSLGLQLVCMLSEQIKGNLNVQSSDEGTTFSIVFPYLK